MSILTSIFGFIKSQTSDNVGQTIGTDLPANWDKVETELNKRPEKSGTLTNGNFAAFNASGQIVDSTKKPSDIPTALSALTDDSTHRVVTDTEKSTWNAKQAAITEGTDYCGIDPNNSGKINPVRACAAIATPSASFTLALMHQGVFIACINSSALVVTIPTNASVAFPIGTEIEINRNNSGTVTIEAASGVTLNSPETARTISKQYASVCLKKVNTDSWILQGALG